MMNQSIQDLARQCGATAEDGSRATEVFCFTDQELRVFAELVAQGFARTDATDQEQHMTRITAAQARELAGPTIEERVAEVYPMIRAAASKGMRAIWMGTGFWAQEGYSNSTIFKEACDILRNDGFHVKFYYEQRQFVDMGTEVSW